MRDFSSVPDPDPVGSVSLARIRIRFRKRWSGSGHQKKIVINSHTTKLNIFNFFLRNHLFCLIYANNNLKKNIVLNLIQKKLTRKKLEFGRIRIRIPNPSSRKRIRGSGSASKWYGSETLDFSTSFCLNPILTWDRLNPLLFFSSLIFSLSIELLIALKS